MSSPYSPLGTDSATRSSLSLPAAGRLSATSTPRDEWRVLHVINGEQYAGAERVQDLLAQRLPDHGFPLTFACVKPSQFLAARHCKTVRVIETPMKHSLDLRAARLVATIAKRGEYHLLHAHTPRSLLIAAVAARWTRIPLIFHVHSPTSRDSTRWLRNYVNQWVERLCLSQVDALITVSRSLARHMAAQGFDRNRIHVVPNGTPRTAELPQRPAPQDAWTLGMIALFRPRKGIEVLLHSLAQLRQQGRSVRLRTVGSFESPAYQRQVLELAARLNLEPHIDWIGFQSDVASQFQQMDALVQPSLFGEGLPMVVLEAMSAGVPVIATEVEGIPEALADGYEGLLAPPNDPVALAASIERLLSGEVDWRQLRQDAWVRHRGDFSDVSMAQGVAKVYRKVLGLR